MFKFLFKSKFLGFVEAPVGVFFILLQTVKGRRHSDILTTAEAISKTWIDKAINLSEISRSVNIRDEQIFEHIRIFEYFSSNINYSNTNIQILPHKYIRIFEIFPRIFTNILISKILYMGNFFMLLKPPFMFFSFFFWNNSCKRFNQSKI